MKVPVSHAGAAAGRALLRDRAPPSPAAPARPMARCKRLNLQGGETIAIFGQGPVGLSATQLAVAMGARVIALDVAPERRELAQEFGAARGDRSHGRNDLVGGDPRPDARRGRAQDARRLLGARKPAPRRCARCALGHRLLRRRARPGDARRQPRPPAPAGDAGRVVDLLEAGPGRMRRVRRRPQGRRRASSSPTAGGSTRPRRPTGCSTRRRPARA